MKVPILRLLSALMKIFQIPHFIFQTTSQFFLKFASLSSVVKDNSSVPYLAQTFGQKQPIKV